MKTLPSLLRHRYILSLLFIATVVFASASPLVTSTVLAQNPPAAASGQCPGQGEFLRFPRWYDGLCDSKGNIDMKAVKSSNAEGAGSLGAAIWTIVLNIIAIMLHIVGYVSLGFIIWGGIKFIISGDNANGVASARKTILNAIIGLVLSIMSTAIVNVIAGTF